MAEVSVSLLLAKLVPFLVLEVAPFLAQKCRDVASEHVNLMTEIQDGIRIIKDEFEQIWAFLRVADGNEDDDPQLKAWVKQVREAAYDTMDVVDQFIFNFELHQGDPDGLFRYLFKFFTASTPAHEITREIARIKSKVNHATECYHRYYRGGTYALIESNTADKRLWYERHSDALQLEEHEALGIERPKSELVSWLLQEQPRLQVFAVVGMAGLGKTTLVKKVFDDVETRANFESHAWVSVSKSFKIQELLEGLIEKLFQQGDQPVPPSPKNKDPSNLKYIINSFLKQRRYLVVLDNVCDIDTWHALRYAFPDSGTGTRSRVILTTTNVAVATLASKECNGKVYHLSPMSTAESWTLFCNKAFHGQTCPSHLERVSRCILERCGGLPLAIVAVAGLLSTKDKRDIETWEKVYRSLSAELQEDGKLLWLKKILSISYYDLPHYLKLCFLYMSIYPKNYLIDHWTLIRLWVAEGFIEPKQNMMAEEVAEDYLTELVNRSLIILARSRVDGNNRRVYRIHNIWHDIITAKSSDQNLITIADKQQQICWPNKIRRLSIHAGFDHWNDLCDRSFYLRSLLLIGAKNLESKLSVIFHVITQGPKLMKVLDMRYCSLDSIPKEIFMQVQLKYLSLRGTKVSVIPKSIEKLQMLETLDLKGTDVKELPNQILKLRRLRYLLVYHRIKGCAYTAFHSHFGFRALEGIGGLSSLQKLCSVELNQDKNDGKILREIGKLTQLRRLNILQLRSEDGRELCSSLDKLSTVRSLSVIATDEDETIDLETISSPPQFLRTLNLSGYLPRLPHWISSLKNLAKLQLRFSKMWEDPLDNLQDLPNLMYLSLEQAYQGDVMCFPEGGFRQLTVLWLVRLSGLQRVIVMEGAMPLLEELHISDCAMVEALPSGINSLSCLRQLELCDMPRKLISTLRHDVETGAYLKYRHMLDVTSSSQRKLPLHMHEAHYFTSSMS